MNAIQISNVTISQTESLFSLADLHKASGGKEIHKPSQWLRNQQTQELITEIEAQGKQAVQTIHGGNKRGTYVCRELVVSYGMWISAAFALQVIQVFLAAQEPSGSLKLSPAQKQQIQAAVMARHHRTGEHWQEIYRKLHAYCSVNSYHEINAADFDRALGYLNSIQDAPELFRQPEAPKLRNLQGALIHGLYCAEFIYHHYEALRLLNRKLAAGIIDHAKDGAACLRDVAEQSGLNLPNGQYFQYFPWDGDYDAKHRYNALFA